MSFKNKKLCKNNYYCYLILFSNKKKLFFKIKLFLFLFIVYYKSNVVNFNWFIIVINKKKNKINFTIIIIIIITGICILYRTFITFYNNYYIVGTYVRIPIWCLLKRYSIWLIALSMEIYLENWRIWFITM